MSGQSLLLQVQGALRKNGMLLPGGILLSASLVVIYKHLFVDKQGDNSATKLMYTILMTNVPIFYVDARMPASKDPLGLLSKFGPKVLFMHMCFLSSRFDLLWQPHVWMLNFTNVAGFMMVAVVLFACFRFHECFQQHVDAFLLVGVSIGAAVATEALSTWSATYRRRNNFVRDCFHSSSMYIELLTFLPACWILWRFEKKDAAAVDLNSNDRKLQAFGYVFVMVAFYLLEDVITLLYYWDSWFMLSTHVFHYLLLVDLSIFIASYAMDPSSNKGTILGRMTENFSDFV